MRFCVLILLFFALPSLAAAKKVALVVGNGTYENTVRLANPVSDANAVAAKLERVGFDVIHVEDVDQREFGAAVSRFSVAAEGADAAVFYFAGHGMQMQNENYLLSTDARVESEFSITSDGLQLSRILQMMEARAELSIALIDACRDNPLSAALAQRVGGKARSIGLSRGLAQLNRPVSESLVAFATSPGAVALDGDTQNSPFTTALLAHLGTQGLEISTMLKRVTADVLRDTKGQQRPEVSSQMSKEFYFIEGELTITGEITIKRPDNNETEATDMLGLALVFRNTSAKRAALRKLVDKYPETSAAKIAERQLAALPTSVIPKSQNDVDGAEVSSFAALVESAPVIRKQWEAPRTHEDIEKEMNLSVEDYRGIQSALSEIGFDAGAPDGQFGARSRKALVGFQLEFGFEGSGHLTPEIMARLASEWKNAPLDFDGVYEVHFLRSRNVAWTKKNDPQYVNEADYPTSIIRFRRVGARVTVLFADDLTRQFPIDAAKIFARISDTGDLQMDFVSNFLTNKSVPVRVRVRHALPPRYAKGRRVEFLSGSYDPAFNVKVRLKRIEG